MPEMRFIVRWPDGRRESCYSPSLVVKEFFVEGEAYTLADFLSRSRQALGIASDRVKAKYGHACSLALGQLARIEATLARIAERDPVLNAFTAVAEQRALARAEALDEPRADRPRDGEDDGQRQQAGGGQQPAHVSAPAARL